MAFSRDILPREAAMAQALTSDLVSIGMIFAANASRRANIEDTVFRASIEGMDEDDLRILSVLTTWLGIHFESLNVDRLGQIVAHESTHRVKAYWSAVAKWLSKDRRFSKMAKIYKGPPIDLLRTGSEFQLKRRGEDKRFTHSSLRVPAQTLRDRKADVLTPAELARANPTYRWRMTIGPSYRADMWAELEQNSVLSPSELARSAYGSFATAWNVKKDWRIVHAE